MLKRYNFFKPESFYTFTKEREIDSEKTVIGADKENYIIYLLKRDSYQKHEAQGNVGITKHLKYTLNQNKSTRRVKKNEEKKPQLTKKPQTPVYS